MAKSNGIIRLLTENLLTAISARLLLSKNMAKNEQNILKFLKLFFGEFILIFTK